LNNKLIKGKSIEIYKWYPLSRTRIKKVFKVLMFIKLQDDFCIVQESSFLNPIGIYDYYNNSYIV